MTTTDQAHIPQALALMLPSGRAAHLAARVLAHAELIELALTDFAEAKGVTSTAEGSEASNVACLVQDFRHVLAEETASLKDHPACAPLTGTSSRSIVHTIADSISTMPEPGPGDGGWRHAARRQVERTGDHYAQVWVKDATYWEYTGRTVTEEGR